MLRITNFFTAMYTYCVSSDRTNFAMISNSDSTCGIHLYAKKWYLYRVLGLHRNIYQEITCVQ